MWRYCYGVFQSPRWALCESERDAGGCGEARERRTRGTRWPNGTIVLPHRLRGGWGRPWWRHQMETFSALLALCVGNSPVTGAFSTQRPVTRSFDVFFDLCLNKRLGKQSWGWRFEPPSRSLWRQRNGHCRAGILALCPVVNPPQLLPRSSIRRFQLQVPDLQMRVKLTHLNIGHQDCSRSNDDHGN